MPNRLPIPEELQSLIEKREQEERRLKQRRVASNESGAPQEQQPTERRSGDEPRFEARRETDQ